MNTDVIVHYKGKEIKGNVDIETEMGHSGRIFLSCYKIMINGDTIDVHINNNGSVYHLNNIETKNCDVIELAKLFIFHFKQQKPKKDKKEIEFLSRLGI